MTWLLLGLTLPPFGTATDTLRHEHHFMKVCTTGDNLPVYQASRESKTLGKATVFAHVPSGVVDFVGVQLRNYRPDAVDRQLAQDKRCKQAGEHSWNCLLTPKQRKVHVRVCSNGVALTSTSSAAGPAFDAFCPER